MKSELKCRELLANLEKTNRNAEEVAALVNSSGLPESKAYMESITIEHFLRNWLLIHDETKDENLQG